MEAAHQDILLQSEYRKMFGELKKEKAAHAADVRMLSAKIEEVKAAHAADVRRLSGVIAGLEAEAGGVKIACAFRTRDYDDVCAERDMYKAMAGETGQGGGGDGGEGRAPDAVRRLTAENIELRAKIEEMDGKLGRTASVLRFHDNPNSPSSSRSIYYRKRSSVRRAVGSHSSPAAPAAPAAEGGRGGGKSGGKKEKGAQGGPGAGTAGKGGGGGAAGGSKRQKEQQRRRPKGSASRRGGTEKSEASFRIPLGDVSGCCTKPIDKSSQVVRERHVDLVGPWLFDMIAVDERGAALQELARSADRAGGAGRCCHCTLLHDTGCARGATGGSWPGRTRRSQARAPDRSSGSASTTWRSSCPTRTLPSTCGTTTDTPSRPTASPPS